MKKYIFILVCQFCVVFGSTGFSAAENFAGFSSKYGYDVYFYNAEGFSSIIKNIDIIGFKDFADKTFMVFKSHDFKLNDVEGFVSMESVIAIIPNQQFRVEKNSFNNLQLK